MAGDHRATEEEPRRLTRKGQATRERILATAAQLMFERGVAGTSVADVKQRAGVSSSQVYNYFADRQALIRGVIDYQTEAVLSRQEPLLSHLDSIEALRAWRDQAIAIELSLECRGGCPIGSLAGELAEADDVARQRLADGFARWEVPIRDGLRAMHDRGELQADADPHALAVGTLAALQGGLLLTQLRRDPAPLEAALNLAIDRIESLAA